MHDRPGFWEWIGLRAPDTSVDAPAAQWVVRILLLVPLVLFVVALAAAAKLLFGVLMAGDAGMAGGAPFGTAAVLVVAILGAPFVVWRAVVAQKTVNVAEQGHITDRISKAVENLGAEKTVKQVFETPRHRKDGKGDWLYEDGRLVQATGPDGAPLVDRETVERTVPNLEVRIGAIYALERIAKDSLRDHIQIMEILCAYIRENAPASQAPDFPKPSAFDQAGNSDPQSQLILRGTHRNALAVGGTNHGPARPREDVQTALTVIGRRGDRQRERERFGVASFQEAVGDFPEGRVDATGKVQLDSDDDRATWTARLSAWTRGSRGHRLDLRRVNLVGATLQDGNFEHALFSSSRLDAADFRKANLSGTNLENAELTGAQLWHSNLKGADLRRAKLDGARFKKARLTGANLSEASLAGVQFAEARLQGTNFTKARLSGTNFYKSRVFGANFREARLCATILANLRLDEFASFADALMTAAAVSSVNLSHAKLSGTQIESMFGDATVILPDGITPDHSNWPAHWPREVLSQAEFDDCRTEWLARSTAQLAPPST